MIWFVRVSSIFLSALAIGNGVAILLVDRFLLDLCRRSCGGESILLLLFGNSFGRIVAGCFTITIGLLLLWYGVTAKVPETDYYSNSESD